MATQRMSLEQLGPTLIMVSRMAERNGVKAMRKGATFGKAAVIVTIKRTRDPFRIRASGAYENPGNWLIQPTDDGAILSPTTEHSLFVERGRPPGHKPPYERILEWAYQKRIGRRPKSMRYYHTGTPKMQKFVKAVRWKIARRGTKGRWPLKRTMPMIAKYTSKEVRKGLHAALGKRPKPGRTRRR